MAILQKKHIKCHINPNTCCRITQMTDLNVLLNLPHMISQLDAQDKLMADKLMKTLMTLR